MFTIHLHQLNFYAFHGLYEEEKIIGGNFEVNIDIIFKNLGEINSLDQTVDYAAVYEIIKKRMLVPTALLETVAQDISETIFQLSNKIQSVSVNIKKITPPINNFSGSVGVTYLKENPDNKCVDR